MARKPLRPTDPLLRSWILELQDSEMAWLTVDNYARHVQDFLWWLGGVSLIDASHDDVRQWQRDMRADNLARSTRRIRLRTLVMFFSWMNKEGLRADNPALDITAPASEDLPTRVLSKDELRTLLADCKGNNFLDIRDRAILLTFIDAGPRLEECSMLQLEDFDPQIGFHFIGKGANRRGKRHRTVPGGAKSTQAVLRYLAMRSIRPVVSSTLWISQNGKALAYDGIRRMVERRGLSAGITGLHPHILRHTWADGCKRAGMSLEDLMRLGGWYSISSVLRYGRATAEQRALEAGRKASLGDQL